MQVLADARRIETDRQTLERVLNWRAKRLPELTIQAVMFGLLCWVTTGNNLVVAWGVAVLAAGALDATLSKALLRRPDDRRLTGLTCVTRVLSASVFNSIAFIVVSRHAAGAMGAALLLGCATNLNNVMMTRGSRLCALTLVGPSAAVLLTAPLFPMLLGWGVEPQMLALMEISVIIYLVFVGRLAATLHQEGEAMREARDTAQSADRSKSAFLATVSHEIRTPLNGVLGMAQAMKRDELSDVQRERLGVISESGEALLAILNDVLDLSKIEAGKLELELVDFDLEELARGAHAAFTPIAERKGVSFDLVIDDEARGAYRGDSVRVRQVLYNLISNAVKFTAQGGVTARLSKSATGVRIDVTDTGIGIPQDRIDALFEKFVQADATTTRRFGGTGLGLAICRELCEAMGGAISVSSRLGEGSCFTVDLPLAPALNAERAASIAAPSEAAMETDSAVRVLAAEDNPTNQLVLKTLLIQMGVEPVIVGNGAEAVEAWEQSHWDLVLMDVQMPVMDGLAAASAIRAREAETGRAATPIIALTANAMSHQVESYRAAGMNGFLAKPIEIRQLFQTLQSIVDASAHEEASDEVVLDSMSPATARG
jgi:signal transduction histidine kinase/AmiR/NasT family two-component response regulator